ncbi:hypothetical protein CF70_028720 [Cupriavidus sp. SK-3]|nr:hypothetical protein CF70_028720 [Cupriavidus sp. SK-3]
MSTMGGKPSARQAWQVAIGLAAVALGLRAGVACAEVAEPASSVEAAQCGDLIAIVRDSLDREVAVSCARSGASSCSERKRPLLAITTYIQQRTAAGSDDCETLLEVNRRLRALPARH